MVSTSTLLVLYHAHAEIHPPHTCRNAHIQTHRHTYTDECVHECKFPHKHTQMHVHMHIHKGI